MDRESRKDRDLRDVMREDRSRGRHPADTEAERDHRDLLEGMLVLIQGDDEAQFCEALIALGYERGSKRFEHFVSAWRSLKRRRA